MTDDNEMREYYDFSGAARGKHHKKFEEGSNVILLEPEIADMFPTSKEVNEILRPLAKRKREKQNFGT